MIIALKDNIVHSALKQVSFLSSNGLPYIKTGVSYSPTTIAEIEFDTNGREDYMSVFGASHTDDLNMLRMRLNPDNVRGGTWDSDMEWTGGVFNLNERTKVVIDSSRNSVYCNGVKLSEEGYHGWFKPCGLTGEVYLFANHDFKNNSHVSWNNRNITVRIYSFRMSDGGRLLLNLIPVLVKGVGCMYDTVSKKLFLNDGDGEFGYG